jgi:hypothetical protein
LLAVALAMLSAGTALHGLGRIVGRGSHAPEAPVALVLSWGLAVYLALGGWLAALGLFCRPVQIATIGLGLLAHLGWIFAAPTARAAGIMESSLSARAALALAGFVLLLILGAAGAQTGEFSDGDGFLLGALARLDQSGELGDTVSLPRHTQLGGGVILTALTMMLSDPLASHSVDAGLGIGLCIALLWSTRREPCSRTYAGFAVIALVMGVPELPFDLAPRWTCTALVVATYLSLQRAWSHSERVRQRYPAVLLAAATATLLHAGLGLLVVVVASAWRATSPAQRRRFLLGAGGVALATLGGYFMAWTRGDTAVAAHLPWLAPGWPLRALAGGGGALVLWAMLSLATRQLGDRALSTIVLGAATAIAIGTALAPALPSAASLVFPFVVGTLLLLAIAGLEQPLLPHRVPPLAVVSVVAVVLALGGFRFRLGIPPLTSGDRLAAYLAHARHYATSRRVEFAAQRVEYRDALASIAPGARVGLWVERPDLVDYTRHHVIDLRSPASAACELRTVPLLTPPAAALCDRWLETLRRLDLDHVVISASAPLARDGALRRLIGPAEAAAALTVVAMPRRP